MLYEVKQVVQKCILGTHRRTVSVLYTSVTISNECMLWLRIQSFNLVAASIPNVCG